MHVGYTFEYASVHVHTLVYTLCTCTLGRNCACTKRMHLQILVSIVTE